MQDYILDFENHLKNVKRVSKNTLESYLRDIGQFSAYCSLNGIDGINSVNEEVISKYFEYLKFLGKSPTTVLRSVASLRNYFIFLSTKGIIESNPISGVKVETVQKKLPDVLTGKEVLKLLLLVVLLEIFC